jgi:hypothetical protein
VTGNGSTLTALAHVTVPLIEGYAVPTQGHLAFVDDPNTVAISWVTNSTLYTPLVRQWNPSLRESLLVLKLKLKLVLVVPVFVCRPCTAYRRT